MTEIKVGDIVSLIQPAIHPTFDCKAVGTNIKCTVAQILDGVAMVVPWNSGHEMMAPLTNLRKSNIFTES